LLSLATGPGTGGFQPGPPFRHRTAWPKQPALAPGFQPHFPSLGRRPGPGPLYLGIDMATGIIKFWKSEKGYGFIKNDDGRPDIFVHESCLLPGVAPDHGVEVEFDIVKCQKGVQAKNVKRLTIVAGDDITEENWSDFVGQPRMKPEDWEAN
jgi:cold shock protein